MNGLFLQGGGAKGAFQAGVLTALNEKGYKFDVVTGVSVGAIHAYMVLHNSIDKLQALWSSGALTYDLEEIVKGKTIRNDHVIDQLSLFEERNLSVKHAYVNYVEINVNRPTEKIVDLCGLSSQEQLKAVSYSGLLPIRIKEPLSLYEVLTTYDSPKIFGEFEEDMIQGLYDGYKLDGGILNNELCQPFLKHDLSKVFCIPLDNDFVIPKYLVEKFEPENIVVFRSSKIFKPSDLFNINPEFLMELFEEGYQLGKSI